MSDSDKTARLGMARTAWLAGALIVGAGAVMVFHGNRSGGDSPQPGTSTPPPVPTAEPVVAQPSGEGVIPAASLPERAVVGLPEDATPVAAASERRHVDEPGIAVIVIDAETGRPVPGAAVAVAGKNEIVPHASHVEESPAPYFEDLLLRFGRTVTTDVHGLAVLPTVEGGNVVARAGDREGRGKASVRSPEPVVVEIRRCSLLRVRTADRDGRAVAGIPIVLKDRRGRAQHCAVTEGAEGIAEIRRVLGMDAYMSPLEGPLTAAPHLPLGEAPEVEFDPHDPPATPIELELPRTGELIVRVADSRGAAVDSGARVRLTIADAESRRSRDRFLAAVARGRAVFPRAGLNLQFRLIAETTDDSCAASEEVVISGPESPGETVTCDLRLGPPHPRITGRLLDETGRPLADELVHAEILKDTRDLPAPLTTNGEGRFSLPIWHPRDSDHTWGVVFTRPGSGPHEARARVDFDWPLPDGDTDIGDVTVQLDPLIAAGRVIHADGCPFPDAIIKVSGGSLHCWSDALGRFEIRGAAGERALTVSASKPGYTSSAVIPVRPGEMNVELILRSSGGVQGSVRFDEWFAGRDFGSMAKVMTLSRFGIVAEGADGFRRDQRLPLQGTFEFADLPPGPVTIRFTRNGVPLLTVEDVAVVAGQTTRDPRLEEVDLGALFRWLQLDIVDGLGAPLAGLSVSLTSLDRDAETLEKKRTDPQGSVGWLVAAGSQAFRVGADGRRPVEVSWAPQPQRVVLAEGIPVSVVLSSRGMVVPENVTLEVLLSHTAPAKASRRTSSWEGILGSPHPFHDGGTHQFVVPRPGRYELKWIMRKQVDKTLGVMSLPSWSPPKFLDVGGDQGSQAFSIAITEADARALRAQWEGMSRPFDSR